MLVSVGLAAWSWVVVSVAVAGAVLAGGRSPPGADMPSIWGLASRYARFDVGSSFVVGPDKSALALVTGGLEWTVAVFVLAVLFAGVLTALAVWLVRQGYARVVRTAGLVGAVPAPLLVFWFLVSGAVPMPSPATGLGVGCIGPALALAVPLAGFGARMAGRAVDHRAGATVLEAWLLVNWAVGGVAAVSTAVGAPSLGRYVVMGLTNGDLPVFAAAVLVLSAPLVVVSVVREYLWRSPCSVEPRGAFPAPGDNTAVGGLVLLVGSIVVGAGAGAVATSGRSRSLATVVPDVLFHVSLAVVVTTLVSLSIGIALGRLARRRGPGLAGLVLDYATNVPMLGFAVLVLAWSGISIAFDGWHAGLVVGLVTAPVVGRRTIATFEQGYGVAEAIPVGGSVATVGGAMAGFLLIDVAVLRIGLPEIGWLLLQSGRGPVWAVAALVATSLPIVAAFLVSEGLRPAA